MRQGTCRPNFGDEDMYRNWNKEGEQGSRGSQRMSPILTGSTSIPEGSH